jgi:hypothetical protein
MKAATGLQLICNVAFSGGMNDRLCRVQTIHDTTNTQDLATYTYLGLGTVVRITYSQPEVWLDLWGGTSGTFTGIDLFGRIVNQDWQNSITGTAADIDRYQYTYDGNSNRTQRMNSVSSGTVNLDELYGYDNLSRLTGFARDDGNSVNESWSLDKVGNWNTLTLFIDGSSALYQNRTSNTVNEYTALSGATGSLPPRCDLQVFLGIAPMATIWPHANRVW